MDRPGLRKRRIVARDASAPLSASPTRSVTETNSGSRTATFTIRLSAAETVATTVPLRHRGRAGHGRRRTTGLRRGHLTFAPGEISKTLPSDHRRSAAGARSESFAVHLTRRRCAHRRRRRNRDDLSTTSRRICIDDAADTGRECRNQIVQLHGEPSFRYDEPVSLAVQHRRRFRQGRQRLHGRDGNADYSPRPISPDSDRSRLVGDRVPEFDRGLLRESWRPIKREDRRGKRLRHHPRRRATDHITDVMTAEGRRHRRAAVRVHGSALAVAYDQPVTVTLRDRGRTAVDENGDYGAEDRHVEVRPGRNDADHHDPEVYGSTSPDRARVRSWSGPHRPERATPPLTTAVAVGQRS